MKTIDSVSFSDMSEKDFQDSLACEQISKIAPCTPKKISKISKISLAREREA